MSAPQSRSPIESQPEPSLKPDRLPRALFGYDRSTIVQLLDTMSERIRTLGQDRAERDRRIEELELELARIRGSQRVIGETLVSAREEAQAIREDARRSAEKALRSARERADQIVEAAERAARDETRELVGKARREAEALVGNAQVEQRTMLDAAGRARAFVQETHEQLSDFLMAAVKWYEQAKLPSERTPSADAPAQTPGEAPSSHANDRSSIPSARIASGTRGSQSASSSHGRSDA